MTSIVRADLRAQAAALGFTHVAVTPAVPSPFLSAYLDWIAAGMHGTMGYLARPDRVARRRDLGVIVPGAQSIILVAVDYRTHLPNDALADPRRGRIASYAWTADYHDRLLPRLEALAAALPAAGRAYVDTGAVLERGHAHAAGMGFIGKNTMLIHPRRGSYFFLGEIITTAACDDYDQPVFPATMCGSCTRCLAACPTDAFPAPHILDARRCISYLTIEHKEAVDPALRPLLGNWVFGCDVCQEVCPWNRFTPLHPAPWFAPVSLDHAAPPLADLLALDDAEFRVRFAGSPLIRTGRDRVVRNACIAAGNSGDPALLAAVRALLTDPSVLVRDHAAWAVAQLTMV